MREGLLDTAIAWANEDLTAEERRELSTALPGTANDLQTVAAEVARVLGFSVEADLRRHDARHANRIAENLRNVLDRQRRNLRDAVTPEAYYEAATPLRAILWATGSIQTLSLAGRLCPDEAVWLMAIATLTRNRLADLGLRPEETHGLDAIVTGITAGWGAVLRPLIFSDAEVRQTLETNLLIREDNLEALAEVPRMTRHLVIAVNDYREMLGLRRLEVSSPLMEIAQAYAETCRQRPVGTELRHCLDGFTAMERARAENWRGQWIGEVLREAEEEETSPQATLMAWIGSDSHREILQAESAEQIGVGQSGRVWVANLGQRNR